MSDKNLTESEWKKFSKGRGLKDAPLLKALTELERAVKEGPDAELEALAEVEKQAEILKKANKADKELTDYLDDTDKALTKARKLAEAAAKKANAEADASDDEEDSPAQLTTKLLPLVRMVRKGETMQVKIAVTGKEVAVMMAKRSISPARNKLLSDYLGVSGGVKFISGECLLEQNALTFVVQSQAAGLAKKLKAALLKQVELRLKVRVRGLEADDVDEDGEEEEDETESTGDGDSQAVSHEKSAEQQAYEERLAILEPRCQQALREQTSDASKIRAVDAFVREKAAGGQFGAALKGLDSLEKLLSATTTAPPPPAPPPPPPGAAGTKPAAAPADADTAAFNARLATMMPRVKEVMAANSAVAQDLKLKVSEAGMSARGKEFGVAHALLDDAEKLLGDGAADSTPADVPIAPTPPNADASAAFNARLAALLPRVKDALTAGGEHAIGIKTKVSDAGGLARTKDLEGANRLLNEVEALLQEAAAQPTATDGAALWEARRAALEPRYLTMLKERPGEATRMRALFGMADEQAEAGEFDAALGLLNRLDTLLDTPTPDQGSGYTGIVAYRKTLLDLRAAVAQVEGQIATLLETIPDQMPDEVDLVEALADELNESTAELEDLIDEAMGTAENEDTPITRELTDRLEAMINEMASNEVIQHMDANAFGVPVSIAATLGKALTDVRAALPIPA